MGRFDFSGSTNLQHRTLNTSVTVKNIPTIAASEFISPLQPSYLTSLLARCPVIADRNNLLGFSRIGQYFTEQP